MGEKDRDMACESVVRKSSTPRAAGISSEYPINRYFRDAKVLQIIEGTNQIQRNIISNSLLGRPARK